MLFDMNKVEGEEETRCQCTKFIRMQRLDHAQWNIRHWNGYLQERQHL